MQKGNIGVTTENIFPIIKKFLYSDHEIFLRELIANAIDATQKLKTLSQNNEVQGELGDLTIRVKIDGEKLIISDNGIGMTAEEVDKYLNQIAFSSADEFIKKYKDQSIIGHFGLGFYSAFMVASKVEVHTLSYKTDAEAVKWTCDGSPEYTLEPCPKATRGTDITLYITDEDVKQFLEQSKITELLTKYCKFLPVPIAFGKKTEWKDGKQVETTEDNIINDTNPLWTRKPADLKDEDYTKFYQQLYPMQEPPMFNIHLNVDYPFNLTGILYFPKLRTNLEFQKNKIQLYCNQVFVTDSVEGIVPDFLTLLHGVIDSPDIPLNVSRSYLQSDTNVKKISSHITKKVADRLEEIFKKQRPEFEEKWDNLKLFIQYGIISEEKFAERAAKFALLKNTENKYFTLEEYLPTVKDAQTDSKGKTVILYATDTEAQYSFIQAAKARNYDVLLLDGQLDMHYVNHAEQKNENIRFARVDADTLDKLIPKADNIPTTMPENDQEDLRAMLTDLLPSTGHFYIEYAALGQDNQPTLITQPEFMRRMKDMAAITGNQGMNFYASMGDSYTMVINTDNPLIQKLVSQKEDAIGKDIAAIRAQLDPVLKSLEDLNTKNKDLKSDDIPQADKDLRDGLEKQEDTLLDQKRELLSTYAKQNQLAQHLIDLALLANNMLKGEALNRFVLRNTELLK